MNDVTTNVASLVRCCCGHSKEAHMHLRRGKDCAACDCRHFRKPGTPDTVLIGTWIGILLASFSILALTVAGTVKFFQWLF